MPKRKKSDRGKTRVLKDEMTIERSPEAPELHVGPNGRKPRTSESRIIKCKRCGSGNVHVLDSWPAKVRQIVKDESHHDGMREVVRDAAKRKRFCHGCGHHFWSTELVD